MDQSLGKALGRWRCLEIVFVFREVLGHGVNLACDVVPLIEHRLGWRGGRLGRRLFLSHVLGLGAGAQTGNCKNHSYTQSNFFHQVFSCSLVRDGPCYRMSPQRETVCISFERDDATSGAESGRRFSGTKYTSPHVEDINLDTSTRPSAAVAGLKGGVMQRLSSRIIAVTEEAPA